MRKLRSLIKGYEGSDAQSTLQAIPAISILIDQFTDLNNEIEDIRDPLTATPERLTFDKNFLTGFDPERIHVGRAHEVVAANNATLVNQIVH